MKLKILLTLLAFTLITFAQNTEIRRGTGSGGSVGPDIANVASITFTNADNLRVHDVTLGKNLPNGGMGFASRGGIMLNVVASNSAAWQLYMTNTTRTNYTVATTGNDGLYMSSAVAGHGLMTFSMTTNGAGWVETRLDLPANGNFFVVADGSDTFQVDGTTIWFGSSTAQRTKFVAGDAGGSPGSTGYSAPVDMFGGVSYVLGEPAKWLTVVDSTGSEYMIPLYAP